MFCTQCGHEISDGNFCRFCGFKVETRKLEYKNTNTLLRSNVTANTLANLQSNDKNANEIATQPAVAQNEIYPNNSQHQIIEQTNTYQPNPQNTSSINYIQNGEDTFTPFKSHSNDIYSQSPAFDVQQSPTPDVEQPAAESPVIIEEPQESFYEAPEIVETIPEVEEPRESFYEATEIVETIPEIEEPQESFYEAPEIVETIPEVEELQESFYVAPEIIETTPEVEELQE
ncbi:MAG: hypothetical protein R3Y35_14190, partial [Clostridia bacterium]